jgi:hypothetical protein
MAGVFAVAEQLSLRGWIVSPTSRNARGVDLLMTKEEADGSLAGQVKADRTPNSFWLVGKKDKTPHKSLFYFFVKFHVDGVKDIYVVPSKVVSKRIYSNKKRTMWAVEKQDISKFKDRYDLLER